MAEFLAVKRENLYLLPEGAAMSRSVIDLAKKELDWEPKVALEEGGDLLCNLKVFVCFSCN